MRLANLQTIVIVMFILIRVMSFGFIFFFTAPKFLFLLKSTRSLNDLFANRLVKCLALELWSPPNARK